jgi:nucleotide-binding universal stress UspA family protein
VDQPPAPPTLTVREDRILNAAAETVSAAALLAVLAWAVIRPRGWPEAVAAVPAAALVIATGAISPRAALAEAGRLAPVIGFLAAVLVLAQLCDDEGLFRACGTWMARRSAGRPRRLLAQVFATASAITAVLSLDATVVLLTPVVYATSAQLGARPRPHVYACTHLANSASLLLPVSNLTNLLAFAASGLAFPRFAALMALPWLAAIATEYLVLTRFFASDLDAGAQGAPAARAAGAPVFVLMTVAATLAGFVATSAAGLNPAWAAFAGAAVLAVRALAAHGAYAGLLGRGHPERDPGPRLAELAAASAGELLAAAAHRLGRPCTRTERRGRIEREVVAAAAGADLLVLARDGDRSRLGPKSLGRADRFVVDHAPCPVLLVWPDGTPGTHTIPPPPPRPSHHRPHRR